MDDRADGSESLWFSSSMRFAQFTEKGDYYSESVSVFVFKAIDHERAFARALELGRNSERIYTNMLEQNIRHALVAVISLSCLGDHIDGTEVYYVPGEDQDASPYAWNHVFQPEDSQPYPDL